MGMASPGQQETSTPRRSSNVRPKGHVTLPYVAGVTEPISPRLCKAGVAAHSKPHKTIRQMLVAPKDKDSAEDVSGVVYNIKCKDCEAEYIGETGRALTERLKEHKMNSSVVCHHAKLNKHKIDMDNVEIVDRDSRWFERGVREAIYIRARSPSLNRDLGRHTLPPIYDTLVKSCDPNPPGGSHDTPLQS